MRKGLIVWWLVWATGWSTDYVGPFLTRASCEAAKKGAIEFSVPVHPDCVTPEEYDDYLQMQPLYYDYGGYPG